MNIQLKEQNTHKQIYTMLVLYNAILYYFTPMSSNTEMVHDLHQMGLIFISAMPILSHFISNHTIFINKDDA